MKPVNDRGLVSLPTDKLVVPQKPFYSDVAVLEVMDHTARVSVVEAFFRARNTRASLHTCVMTAYRNSRELGRRTVL